MLHICFTHYTPFPSSFLGSIHHALAEPEVNSILSLLIFCCANALLCLCYLLRPVQPVPSFPLFSPPGTCIAEYESTFNSAAVNTANWDGSKDYGLFQLNNNYWCGDEYGKNVCGIPCSGESFCVLDVGGVLLG